MKRYPPRHSRDWILSGEGDIYPAYLKNHSLEGREVYPRQLQEFTV